MRNAGGKRREKPLAGCPPPGLRLFYRLAMVLVAPSVAIMASIAIAMIWACVAIAMIWASVAIAISIAVIATAVATAIMSPGVSVIVGNLFSRGIAFR